MAAIRLGTRADLDSLSVLLYESFFDDPGWNYVLPRVALRASWLARLMRAGLEVSLDHGLVWLMPDEQSGAPVGVALWFPAGRPFPPPWYRTLIPALSILDFSLLHFPSAWRYANLQKRMLRLRPREVERCWFLAGLAVAAAKRGSGLGAQLVREGLSRATADRSPTFLQAWGHVAPFYERLGFESVSQFSLAKWPHTCHGMLWQPPATE